MWKIVPVFLVLMAPVRMSAQSPVPTDAEQSRIVALENSWNRAVQQKDGAALTLLLAPELIYVDYDGKLMDKSTYVASVLSPSVHPARVVSESVSVHIFGMAAVVTGVYRENGMKNGKPYILRERFTDTWIIHGKGWVCVASHSTLIGQ